MHVPDLSYGTSASHSRDQYLGQRFWCTSQAAVMLTKLSSRICLLSRNDGTVPDTLSLAAVTWRGEAWLMPVAADVDAMASSPCAAAIDFVLCTTRYVVTDRWMRLDWSLLHSRARRHHTTYMYMRNGLQ